MDSNSGIFIFTRDRPSTLEATLMHLGHTDGTIFIVDDSEHYHNQKSVESISKNHRTVYLGQKDFTVFIDEHNIDSNRFSFLLRNLGNQEWNLGYARNFALLYSKALGLDCVLFMDDDIRSTTKGLIYELFDALNCYRFTGANITGLVDDSILGHIATSVNITNDRMLSGGFMAFKPSQIEDFFLNIYNEDWIWLFLQLKREKYLQEGDAIQNICNIIDNYQFKVLFQEKGEVVLDGILDLLDADSFNELEDDAFWDRIIEERKDYIKLLNEKSKNEEYLNVILYVQNNFLEYNSKFYSNLFREYFANNVLFKTLYNSLS